MENESSNGGQETLFGGGENSCARATNIVTWLIIPWTIRI